MNTKGEKPSTADRSSQTPTVQAAAAPAWCDRAGQQAAKAFAGDQVAAVSAQGRWRIGRFFTVK